MYDKDKLLDAIWNNPGKVIPLNWIYSGNKWQAAQYPDGSEGKGRADRTTLKKGMHNQEETIFLNCNGSGFRDNNIWGFLHEYWNTNNHVEVLQRVGEAYGIQPDLSRYSQEQIQLATKRRTEKDLLRHLATHVEAALSSTHGEVARRYLESRALKPSPRLGAYNSEIRQELIALACEKGNMTSSAAASFIDKYFCLPKAYQDATPDNYQLVIPYTSGEGNVMGFTLRRTATEEGQAPKYLYSYSMPKGGYCGKVSSQEAVILVEGILDAEAMKQNGFNNVIALGGQTPTDNPDRDKSIIATLKRYGTKQIVYIPDYEYNGQAEYPAEEATTKTIEKLLPHITGAAAGEGFLSLDIASMETPEAKRNKTKVDADLFLRQQGAAAMQQAITSAIPWYEYGLQSIIHQNQGNPEMIAAKAQELYCLVKSPTQRSRIRQQLSRSAEGYWQELKEAGLDATALASIDKYGEQQTWSARIREIVQDMQRAKTPGRIAELLAAADKVQNANKFSYFADQVNATREELHRQVIEKPAYLETNWKLYEEDKTGTKANFVRRLSFAPSAVSIIAAPVNHCKTLVLLQTAINTAKDSGKKHIYISLENDPEQLYIRALACYTGEAWNEGDWKTTNPRSELRRFIRDPKSVSPESLAIMIDGKIEEYWQHVAPYLCLLRTSSDIDAIVNNIEGQLEAWNNEGIEAGAVFVDYLQLLHCDIGHTTRTEEVKAICDKLNDLAKRIKVPVILAAQLNRDATKNNGDKLDGVSLANIGESAGIENIAEDVYLAWNTNKISTADYANSDPSVPGSLKIPASNRRSRRCFANVQPSGLTNVTQLLANYIYIENLKARDYATGGYCLIATNYAAGSMRNESTNAFILQEKQQAEATPEQRYKTTTTKYLRS